LAYSLLRYRLGPVLIAAGLWGGCYTGPVNMPPTVHINPPSGRIFRGQAATYTATASDPDHEGVTLRWAWTPGHCPADFLSPSIRPAAWATRQEPDADFVMEPANTRSPFCVWVMALDRYGAAAVDVTSTEPDNHPPIAVLDLVEPQTATPFPIHTTFRLSAVRSSDVDNDMIFEDWMLASPSPAVILEHCPGDSSETLRCFTADVPGNYEVQVRVSDMVDESPLVKLPLTVVPGHAPVAFLDVLSPPGTGPFPLGSTFHLTLARSKDADPGETETLTPSWSDLGLTEAPGSIAQLLPCPDDAAANVRCFTADVFGRYLVEASVTDISGQSATVMKTFDVLEDKPPCLGLTDPDMGSPMVTRDPTEAVLFQVITVTDDLDPYPNPDLARQRDTEHFEWFLSEGTGPFRSYKGDFPTLTIPAEQYLIGDQIRIRVETRDRVADRSQNAFTACGAAASCFAGAPADGCFQRFTWTVNFLQ
jgi:hypothetical protein